MAAFDDRTGFEIVPADECWALMTTKSVGRLVVVLDDQPEVFPVNYTLDERTIVIRTESGTKLAGALAGRVVAFEVDEVDEVAATGWSVVVKGVAHEVLRPDTTDRLEELGLRTWSPEARSRWLRVQPEEITGRRI